MVANFNYYPKLEHGLSVECAHAHSIRWFRLEWFGLKRVHIQQYAWLPKLMMMACKCVRLDVRRMWPRRGRGVDDSITFFSSSVWFVCSVREDALV